MKTKKYAVMATLNAAMTRTVILLVGAAVLLLPLTTWAQDDSDSWEWRATIYAWLPTIAATSKFPTGGGTPPIEVDAETLLDNLDFTFMGALQVNKGSWGLFTDILYLDEGAHETGVRDFTVGPGQIPGDVSMNVRYDLKATLWTVAGTYGLVHSPQNRVDLTFGARMVDMSQELDWTFSGNIADLPLPGRDGSSKLSVTNWDAVVGLKGFSFIGQSDKWVVPWQVDIGTGDSDFTWQAMAGIGYQFGWGALMLNYRYLDYDTDKSSPVTDLELSGPMFGASFSW